MYVKRNIEARSCNQFCSVRAISVTCSECVFVVVGIQNAMHMRHTFICGLPSSKIFFHIISKVHNFRKRKPEDLHTTRPPTQSDSYQRFY